MGVDDYKLPGVSRVNIATKNRGNRHFPLVSTDIPLSVYGEVRTAVKRRQVSLKYSYGAIPPDSGQRLTNKSGSTVVVTDAQAVITCAAVAEAFSQIRTKDFMRYDPGVGSEMTGTCIFTPGVANSSQVFGSGDDDEGYFFGFDGTTFGVLLRARGSLEIKSLTITSGATNSGDITITLDGTAVIVAVLAGDTIAEVCEKITAETDAFGDAGRGWEVINQDDNTLEFLSLVAENAGGAFSFVDTGTTLVTASAFSETVAGVSPTEDWIPQTDWNVDKMLGEGLSGMTLDITKGNIFRIEFQYHGYGVIVFSIEDSETGAYQQVHIIRYSNNNTAPSILNPTIALTFIAKTELGYSGPALVMKTASVAGFIQGEETEFGHRSSASDTKSIGTTETPILMLSNALHFNGFRNKIHAKLLTVSFSSEATKAVELKLYTNVDRVVGGAALADIEAGVSVMSHGQTGTGISGGRHIRTLSIGSEGAGVRDLESQSLRIKPGERWVITARVASGSVADVSLTINLLEEE